MGRGSELPRIHPADVGVSSAPADCFIDHPNYAVGEAGLPVRLRRRGPPALPPELGRPLEGLADDRDRPFPFDSPDADAPRFSLRPRPAPRREPRLLLSPPSPLPPEPDEPDRERPRPLAFPLLCPRERLGRLLLAPEAPAFSPVSKPGSRRRGIGAPNTRSVSRTQARSSPVIKVKAFPVASERPVRPIRCV